MEKMKIVWEVPHHATVQSVTTDYLRAIVDRFESDLKRQTGGAFKNMSFTYIITAPAIWSDKAKLETLNCAEKAGFESRVARKHYGMVKNVKFNAQFHDSDLK
ncbi:hypothetical protein N7478_007063 [Penicillium angulare]|uniref:uncharacterized protein n=1 Tax=Penicillium angulare TaxID=116970 RepID=UPI0025410903|nr:uncharacterized protein N7478_007063 [Penicillium angulare]KAJ5281691.1 hypothetical protein N7478_007063 [Penicillium angulare]